MPLASVCSKKVTFAFCDDHVERTNESTALVNEEVNLQYGPLSPFGTTANSRMVNDHKCLAENDLDLVVVEERVTSGHS